MFNVFEHLISLSALMLQTYPFHFNSHFHFAFNFLCLSLRVYASPCCASSFYHSNSSLRCRIQARTDGDLKTVWQQHKGKKRTTESNGNVDRDQGKDVAKREVSLIKDPFIVP